MAKGETAKVKASLFPFPAENRSTMFVGMLFIPHWRPSRGRLNKAMGEITNKLHNEEKAPGCQTNCRYAPSLLLFSLAAAPGGLLGSMQAWSSSPEKQNCSPRNRAPKQAKSKWGRGELPMLTNNHPKTCVSMISTSPTHYTETQGGSRKKTPHHDVKGLGSLFGSRFCRNPPNP